jgi:hypothetical protein
MTIELSAEARRRRHNILHVLKHSLSCIDPQIAEMPGYGEWAERTIGGLRDKIEAIPDDQLAVDDDERCWVDAFTPDLHPNNFLLEQVVAAAEAAPRAAQRRRGREGGRKRKYDFGLQDGMTYLRSKGCKFQDAADLVQSDEGFTLPDGRIARTDLVEDSLRAYWRRAGHALGLTSRRKIAKSSMEKRSKPACSSGS